MEKSYSRDSRSPSPKNESVSRSMSGNKYRDTKPEIEFRKAIWSKGIRGYRVNYSQVPGKPDIAFTKKKIAVFINGCFWHRCPTCNYSIPKHNTEYWSAKFEKNVHRDIVKTNNLKELGWIVIVIWECTLKKNLEEQVQRLANILKS